MINLEPLEIAGPNDQPRLVGEMSLLPKERGLNKFPMLRGLIFARKQTRRLDQLKNDDFLRLQCL